MAKLKNEVILFFGLLKNDPMLIIFLKYFYFYLQILVIFYDLKKKLQITFYSEMDEQLFFFFPLQFFFPHFITQYLLIYLFIFLTSISKFSPLELVDNFFFPFFQPVLFFSLFSLSNFVM